MSNPEHDIELIEGYLMDSITPQERTLVQERLLSDSEFEKLFNDIKILVDGIKVSSRNELLQQLQEQEYQLKKSDINASNNVIPINNKSSNKLWQPISIAAGILLLIGIVYFAKPFGSNNSKELASYYDPLPPELIYNFVRSDENTEDKNKLASAAKALINNDANLAKSILHEVIFEDGHQLDTLENEIRVYANILIQSRKIDCSENMQNMKELKTVTSSTPWNGTVLIDQILLAKKCSSDEIEVYKTALYNVSLREYDQERWEKIKELL